MPPAEALLRKAYASLGLQVEFLAWPLARAQVELRHGRLDAVAMRADAFFDHAHESRAAWVVPLEQALRTMRQRGEIQQACVDHERETGGPANRLQAEPGRSLTVKPITREAPAPAPAQPLQ